MREYIVVFKYIIIIAIFFYNLTCSNYSNSLLPILNVTF